MTYGVGLMDPALIPPETIESLVRYRDGHVPAGGFLRAVLENDLQQAIARGDDESLRALPAIASFVFNKLPGGAWGTPEKVRAWIERREPE